MKIQEWPLEERPRERLEKLGAKHLSTAELTAILLRTGKKGESAVLLAQKLLVRFGGLRGIACAELTELAELSGVGKTKAIGLKAALEFGRRATQENGTEKIILNSPDAVFSLYREEMRHKDREVLVALHLDTKRQLLAEETVSVGTLNSSLVHPREVFRRAIKNGAASIILLHNHPSGDPTPSPEDREVTQRIDAVGKLVGISLIDHLIFGDGKYVSLKPD